MEALLLIPNLTKYEPFKSKQSECCYIENYNSGEENFVLFSKMHVFDSSTPNPVKFIKTITKLISAQK